MAVHAFGQQSFAPALTAPGKRRASTFRPHPRTKTVLTFASSFGSLKSAFHKTKKFAPRELRAVTLGWSNALSIFSAKNVDPLDLVRKLPFISGLQGCAISGISNANGERESRH
jgi:hypothetical protein